MITEVHYKAFRKSYAQLSFVSGRETEHQDGLRYRYELFSPDLRPGNGPRIFHHGKKTDHVIVLTHGLSDSPRYMEDIGKAFYQAGLNVILPLLPGHGLRKPDTVFEDEGLDEHWRQRIGRAVELAASLGDTISLGGFSTGGALSYNRILRDMDAGRHVIRGGLFLFSAAIELAPWAEFLVNITPRILLKQLDNTLEGEGPDPFKYAVLPKFGAKELDDIIDENEALSKGKRLPQPVFAAHFLSDDTADVGGVLHLLSHHSNVSSAFIIGEEVHKRKEFEGVVECANVSHSALPLQSPIPLKNGLGEVHPNPQFGLMMRAAIDFFGEAVQQSS